MPASKLNLIAVTCALVGGVGGSVAVVEALDAHHGSDTVTVTAPASGSARTVSDTTQLTPGQVYSRTAPSVAFITSRVTQQSSGPLAQPQTGTATGTGFVVSSGGLVVTNAHVIEGA